MRNISFALTKQQFLDRSKTVTRRLKWENLKPGTLLRGVEKAMGLKKGEEIKPLGVIIVTDVRREPLIKIDCDDTDREGFPDLTPWGFVTMFMDHMGGEFDQEVTRIEFLHIPGSRVS